MSEPSLTAFVQRAIDTLKVYEQMRAEGMTHGEAIIESGFYDTFVKCSAAKLERDVKALQAGERED
jgi:hypothetical protein